MPKRLKLRHRSRSKQPEQNMTGSGNNRLLQREEGLSRDCPSFCMIFPGGNDPGLELIIKETE